MEGKESAVTDPDVKATINDKALSMVDSVTYIGVTFARNAKWTNHVEGIFRKCVRLSFLQKNSEGCQHLLSIYANLLRRA